jgi:tRNA pseudouridine32 synthase/23S rRNA pseudouridine746 synthase
MNQRPPYIVPYCHETIGLVYADQQLIMVNKPSQLLSVPGRHPQNKDCLATRIQQQYPSARIVHRLDMDTSGVMVLALNSESHKALSRQFEQRKTLKNYEAVVDGLIADDQGQIDLPLCCDWPNRPRQMVSFEHGKAATTRYSVIARDPLAGTTRVELTPVTGRSHQLRVHMASLGHPILGCKFYGGAASDKADRLLLHARELVVQHPLSHTDIKGYSPAPF